MGIDCHVVHADGSVAEDLFPEHAYAHIAVSIEHVSGTGLSVGLRNDVYELIAKLCNMHLTEKYDQEDPYWRREEFISALRYMKRSDDTSQDKRLLQKFFQYLVSHNLMLHIW